MCVDNVQVVMDVEGVVGGIKAMGDIETPEGEVPF